MSNYRERYKNWWELRAIMERELPQGEFIAFLGDTGTALRAYLEPPPPPKMAFDAMPEPEIVTLIAEVMARLTRGDFDGHAIEEARRWSKKMLRNVDCNITAGTASDIAVRKFMRQRVAEWPDDRPAPTEAEDVEALKLQSPRRLTRNEARIVRIDETPDQWRRQGPRQPWGKLRRQ